MPLTHRIIWIVVKTHRSASKILRNLDLTSSYHQIKVDEESSNLLVIATPMGRFKFTVLSKEYAVQVTSSAI